MKLYKFRSLGSDTDLERAEAILKEGKFWCSRFWQLNDPMEGVFRYDLTQTLPPNVETIVSEKAKRVLCSFSGPGAFSLPHMWGYYANGFKGFVIELEDPLDEVKKVDYVDTPTIVSDDGISAEQVLATKLKCWEHEDEHRFIAKGLEPGLHSIGKITALHFGNPYGTVENAKDLQANPEITTYLHRARELKRIAEQDHQILCGSVAVEGGRVTSTGVTHPTP